MSVIDKVQVFKSVLEIVLKIVTILLNVVSQVIESVGAKNADV